jgi:hypothetical protein
MPLPYLPFLIIVICAAFFHCAAEFENESGSLWAGLSLLISVATWVFFHWGWFGSLLGQLGLFVGITIFRMLRKS